MPEVTPTGAPLALTGQAPTVTPPVVTSGGLDSALVELYTGGRLKTGEPYTELLLAAALADARQYCGWHVTPPRVETIIVDGPGGTLLRLPTKMLTALTAVVEDGVVLDVNDLRWSSTGVVLKKSGACWSRYYRSIVVTMTHGYTTAPDFDAAVLCAINRTSFAAASGGASQTAGPYSYTPQGPTEEEKYALEAYQIQVLGA